MEKKPNPYASDPPDLKPSLVCFADVLGWTRRTEQAFKQGKAVELLRQARSALSAAYDGIRDLGKAYWGEDTKHHEVKTFSDNIVIGMPIMEWSTRGTQRDLGFLLDGLSILQLQLASKGFFIRGGVAVRNHRMDQDFVYGSALLEAARQDE